MKKMIALIVCLMLCMAAVPVHAETAESLIEQAKALYAAEDYKGAAELIAKAAETGDAAAQHALGDCYAYSLGFSQDFQKAAEYYTMSADQGYAPAQAALGSLYLSGLGVEADPEAAVKYLRLAADQNDPVGQYYLGFCYDAGIAVEPDPAKAMEYYRLSADQGLLASCIRPESARNRIMIRRSITIVWPPRRIIRKR